VKNNHGMAVCNINDEELSWRGRVDQGKAMSRRAGGKKGLNGEIMAINGRRSVRRASASRRGEKKGMDKRQVSGVGKTSKTMRAWRRIVIIVSKRVACRAPRVVKRAYGGASFAASVARRVLKRRAREVSRSNAKRIAALRRVKIDMVSKYAVA